MNKLTNLIIVDASGSMSSKKPEVIGGLKQLFTDIQKDAKKDKKKVTTTTIVVDFSSSFDFRILINTEDSSKLDVSVAENYSTRGSTALLDAIDKGFALVPPKQNSVFVSILTDGEENDSKEATSEFITSLIAEKKKEDWVITFMGTSEDSIKKAKSMGIAGGNTMFFANNANGVKHSFNKMSNVRSAYYTSTMDFMEQEADASLSNEKKRLLKAKLSNTLDSLIEDDDKKEKDAK